VEEATDRQKRNRPATLMSTFPEKEGKKMVSFVDVAGFETE
jgi:hypothetical protein